MVLLLVANNLLENWSTEFYSSLSQWR